MKEELLQINWDFLFNSKNVNQKLESFHETVFAIFESSFPQKSRRIVITENQPWFNDFLTKLRRRKAREFRKNRMSIKYLELEKEYKTALKRAKRLFYAKNVRKLKSSDSKQWWRQIKSLIKSDNNNEDIEVEELKDLDNEEQANKIAQNFASIRLNS